MNIKIGTRFTVLQNGECIGNILRVTKIEDNAVFVYSEMLKKDMPKKFRIFDLLNAIKNKEAELC